MKFKRQATRKLNAITTLDLTPMVDVVFNLLIFFALSLNFVASSGGINVNLPEAASAKPIRTENITINLTKSGKMYYNKESIRIKSPSARNSIEYLKDPKQCNN